MNLKNNDMRKLSQQLPFLNEIQAEQSDIIKIREQRQLVAKIQHSFSKKEQEIAELKALLEKYQIYQQKYTSLKAELAEKSQLLARRESEGKLLRRQLEELIREQQHNNIRIRQCEADKQQFIRERHLLEHSNKQIELTFKQYQGECKKRENSNRHQLEQAYQQIKEMTTKIDQLQLQASENTALKSRVAQLEEEKQRFIKLESNELALSRERQNIKKITQSSNLEANEALLNQVASLKGELLLKQQQIMAIRSLNYELTIEYDRSVNSICAMEEELNAYRKENNQIKKMLSLQRQQQRCWQLQQKYTRGNERSGDSSSLAPMSAEALSESEQSKSLQHYSTLKQAETFY